MNARFVSSGPGWVDGSARPGFVLPRVPGSACLSLGSGPVQELRHSKVWAPSAREIVALENQIRDMSLQLSSSRQQWLAVTSCSQQPAAAMAGLGRSPTAKLSTAAQQMLSPSTVGRSDALVLDQSTDVQTKIEYLQKQVDSVIEVATVLQSQQRQKDEPPPDAQPSVAV